jgi:hypothetical protein
LLGVHFSSYSRVFYPAFFFFFFALGEMTFLPDAVTCSLLDTYKMWTPPCFTLFHYQFNNSFFDLQHTKKPLLLCLTQFNSATLPHFSRAHSPPFYPSLTLHLTFSLLSSLTLSHTYTQTLYSPFFSLFFSPIIQLKK